MNRFSHLIWLVVCLYGMALLSSCRRHHEELEPKTSAKEVLVVYVMGENSLSGYSYSDLEEMRRGKDSIPDGCRIVLFFDNSSATDQPRIFSIDKHGEEDLQTFDADPVSTDSTTMAEALRTIIQRCPADNYSLVLWSHGSGWAPARRKTIGVDNSSNTLSNTGQEMEISELRWALEQTGVRWRYVMFDACFMQCAEVAYELRNVVDWTIGSPAEIPGDGAPYDVLMPCFFAADAPQQIVERYFLHYENTGGVLISAAKTSEMEQLRQVTRHCIDTLQAQPVDDVQNYCLYDMRTKWMPEFYDIDSGMFHWLSTPDYAVWRSALDRAVPYRRCTPRWISGFEGYGLCPVMKDVEHFGGLSIYVPCEGRDVLNEAAARTSWWQ